MKEKGGEVSEEVITEFYGAEEIQVQIEDSQENKPYQVNTCSLNEMVEERRQKYSLKNDKK